MRRSRRSACILTGVAFEGGLRATRFAGPGVVFAVVALVLFALMAITTDIALESADWLQVLLVSRLVTAVDRDRRGRRRWRGAGASALALGRRADAGADQRPRVGRVARS